MSDDLAQITHDLLEELSTELDLHYDPPEYTKLRSTVETMQRAAEALQQRGVSLPSAYVHVLDRFRHAHN
jgi:hypothetical protein